MRLAYLAAVLATFCAAQTGTSVPALSALDNVMQQALSRYSVKGGSLAVVKDGRLIFARAYGWADAESQTPAQPESLFRWASISKTLTAAAVMSLVDQGKLDRDSPIFTILNQYSPYNGKLGDARLTAITVRQVLHHTGGWDRIISGDPVTGDRTITASSATRTAFPPSRDTVIRYMLAQPHDFAPGARFAYSNFGYMLLGRVIEKVSGKSYEACVRESILTPSGLPRIQLGGSTLSARLPGEVKYYDYPGAPLVSSYVSAAREMEPAPYGFANFDLNDADGAWVSSVIDLAKLTALLDGARPRAPITADSFAAMIAQTPRSTWVDSAGWYGYRPLRGAAVRWHHMVAWRHCSRHAQRLLALRQRHLLRISVQRRQQRSDQPHQLRRAVRLGRARRRDRVTGPQPFPAVLSPHHRAGRSGQRGIVPAGPPRSGLVDDGIRRRFRWPRHTLARRMLLARLLQ
jgi:N-acyl-D-amino-acid deacylase